MVMKMINFLILTFLFVNCARAMSDDLAGLFEIPAEPPSVSEPVLAPPPPAAPKRVPSDWMSKVNAVANYPLISDKISYLNQIMQESEGKIIPEDAKSMFRQVILNIWARRTAADLQSISAFFSSIINSRSGFVDQWLRDWASRTLKRMELEMRRAKVRRTARQRARRVRSRKRPERRKR